MNRNETVLITGGTGLIGRQLASQLRAKGYRVTLLSRTPKAHAEFITYGWNHDTGFLDIRALAEAERSSKNVAGNKRSS